MPLRLAMMPSYLRTTGQGCFEFHADKTSTRALVFHLKRKGVLVRHLWICPWYAREHVRGFDMLRFLFTGGLV